MRTANAKSRLVRRWYILLIGLLLTGALGWGTWLLFPPQYTARGLVMLLPSVEAVGPKGNPMLSMGGLDLPARLLVAYFSSEPAQTSLEEFDPVAEVAVTVEESTRGPILAVDVTHDTPEGALRALDHVSADIPPSLARIQADIGTPESAAVRSMPLVIDDKAKPDYARTIRYLLLACALGVSLTFLAVFALDGLLQQRRTALLADPIEDAHGDLGPG